MDTATRHVALTVRDSVGADAYGAYDARADARLVGDWLGTTEAGVVATRVLALHPPGADPLTMRGRGAPGDVVALDEWLWRELAHTTEAAADHVGPVVALVAFGPPSGLALLVGPFDTRSDVDRWFVAAHSPGGGRCGRLWVLPLRRDGVDFVDLDVTGVETTADPSPAVVMLDTDQGATVVYGPFRNAMDAALYWQDITQILRLTNVSQTAVCELTAPDTQAPPSPPGAQGADLGWVVRLPTTTTSAEMPVLVGPFPDEHAAHAWRGSSGDGSVLPIREP